MSASTQTIIESGALQRWLPHCRLNAGQPKVRLFCFPHAGGTARVFDKWPGRLPWTVQMCAVQLPGREMRLNEPAVTRMTQLVDELSKALLPWIDRPVALFGHSLGAKIAFEFARRIQAAPGEIEIAHLFVSGANAPHLCSAEVSVYDLPDDEFVQRLRHFRGTPREVLEDPSLMRFLAPRLRSDFELDGTYRFEPGEKLSCPVTAWAGETDDLAPPTSVKEWGGYTTGPFQFRALKGAHFALYEREAEVLPEIRRALSAYS